MSENGMSFGEINFGHAVLGDKRRTDKLVELADGMAHRPGGTLPEKFNSPKDLKAMYRLFDNDKVTHQAILAAHQEYLFKTLLPSRSGFTLVIHDATELEYTKHRSLSEELGQIGNGFRRGYIAQNSLVVCPATRATLGLANQVLHRRPKVKQGETKSQRQKRETRESLLWLHGVQRRLAARLPAQDPSVDTGQEFRPNRCHRRYRASGCAHRLRQAWRLPVEHVPRRLRRYITWRETGAPCRHHKLCLACQLNQQLRNQRSLVCHHACRHHVVAGLGEQFYERRS